MNKQQTIEGLLRYNYFPSQKDDCSELPPIFNTKKLSLDILDDVFEIFDSEDYYADFLTHGVAYESSAGRKPRTLSIPEPAAYMQLLKLIHDGYDPIVNELTEKNHLRLSKHDDGRVYIMNYEAIQSFSSTVAKLEFGKRYRVHADIKQCFSSINSSVLSDVCYLSHIDGVLGFILSSGFDSMEAWSPLGLPIGPGVSNLLSELVLSCLDKELLRNQHFDYYRYIDDYVCFVDDLDEAHEFITTLSNVLHQNGLRINPLKTRIVELPEPIEPIWMLDLYSKIPRINDGDYYGNKIIRFLDYALVIAKKNPVQGVMKYAFKCILNIVDVKFDAEISRYLLNLLPYYPSLIPYVGEVLTVLECQDEDLGFSENLNQCLEYWAEKKRSDAMCWLIYWMDLLEVKIKAEIQNNVFISEDSMAILSLYAHGYCKERIIQYVSSRYSIDQEFKERNWLLTYQVYLDNKLCDMADIDMGLVYQLLKNKGVSFVSQREVTNIDYFFEKQVDERMLQEQQYYINPQDNCDLCGCSLKSQKYFVDGQVLGLGWGIMCAGCFDKKGDGIGYGKGQLYKNMDDSWQLVAGDIPSSL